MSDNKSDTKSIVRAYLRDVWEKRNLGAIDDYIAGSYVQHGKHAPPGREGVKAFFTALWGAFSEPVYEIGDVLADGDRVCWRWEMRARHTGAFQNIPATGKSITVSGISIVRIEDGKFVEHWGEQDMLGLMQQLRDTPRP
jgi:predicted ester cyclase